MPVQSNVSQQNAAWIVTFLVILLAVVLMGVSALNNALSQWQGQLAHRVRIEMPDSKPTTMTRVLDLLQQTAGVTGIHLHNAAKTLEEPFPSIPAIIDVELMPGTLLDLGSFAAQLDQITTQSRIETYEQWQYKIGQIAFFLETLSYMVVALIALAVFVTISLVTRSGLVIHREVIDTLQLMGATPTYIAQQFEIQAFRLSLKGGVIGLIAVIPFLYLLTLITRIWQLPEVSSLLPGKWVFLIVLLIPFAVALVSRVIARLAVLRTLATA